MVTGQPGPIEWEAPPPRVKKSGSKWDPVADALKANPGRWARIVTDGSTGISSMIKKGSLNCFKPAGSFETRLHNVHDSWIGDVYARYIGERGEYK